jgi:hypothetical protein
MNLKSHQDKYHNFKNVDTCSLCGKVNMARHWYSCNNIGLIFVSASPQPVKEKLACNVQCKCTYYDIMMEDTKDRLFKMKRFFTHTVLRWSTETDLWIILHISSRFSYVGMKAREEMLIMAFFDRW